MTWASGWSYKSIECSECMDAWMRTGGDCIVRVGGDGGRGNDDDGDYDVEMMRRMHVEQRRRLRRRGLLALPDWLTAYPPTKNTAASQPASAHHILQQAHPPGGSPSPPTPPTVRQTSIPRPQSLHASSRGTTFHLFPPPPSSTHHRPPRHCDARRTTSTIIVEHLRWNWCHRCRGASVQRIVALVVGIREHHPGRTHPTNHHHGRPPTPPELFAQCLLHVLQLPLVARLSTCCCKRRWEVIEEKCRSDSMKMATTSSTTSMTKIIITNTLNESTDQRPESVSTLWPHRMISDSIRIQHTESKSNRKNQVLLIDNHDPLRMVENFAGKMLARDRSWSFSNNPISESMFKRSRPVVGKNHPFSKCFSQPIVGLSCASCGSSGQSCYVAGAGRCPLLDDHPPHRSSTHPVASCPLLLLVAIAIPKFRRHQSSHSRRSRACRILH